MRGLSNVIISTLFVGIPEFIFVSVLAIRILKSLESITVNKFKMALLIIIPAILTNLPDLLGLSDLAVIAYSSFAVSVLSMVGLIYAITRKGLGKVLLSVLGAFLFFVVTEVIMGLPIQLAANITTEGISNNAWIAVLGSAPERAIQFLLLYIFSINYFKKIFTSSAHNLDIFTIINSSRKHRYTAIGIIGMVVIYMTVFVVLFAVKRILSGIPTIPAIFVSMLFMCAPFVTLYIYVESVYRSHISRQEYNKYTFDYARFKTIKAYELALNKGDREVMEALTEVLAVLDLEE